ncbi:hypothetical protein P3G55_21930 [Leptospira sp. 96542]|nr:hypothetical protein [Leptospira sp. 96542]
MPKSIPLKAVQDALMMCQLRAVAQRDAKGRPFARGAAYTQDPSLLPTCRSHASARRLPVLESHGPFMRRGDMQRVLDTVRMHGLPEVRRTFGAGMRQMQAEFARGVL